MVPAKSKATQAMDAAQAEVRGFLKRFGFRSRARTFNRTSSDGITHVIDFQMGRFDPPGTHYVGFRQNLYGRFTANLGIYIPEVARLLGLGGEGSFVREYDCCIRTRLGLVGPDGQDIWWELDAARKYLPDLLHRIERDAFPLFTRFDTRDGVLSQRTEGTGYSDINPSRVVCAIVLATRGQQAEARNFLATEAYENRNHPGLPLVLSLAKTLGIDLNS